MIVRPTSGPVGTTVFIEGRNCSNAGQGVATISLDSNAIKASLPELAENAQGYFVFQWQIPHQAPALVGNGNEAVTPGAYRFDSHPPYCSASFSVTP